MGAFPSGQRGQTVNLLSLTSVVRIHPLPPTKNALLSTDKSAFFELSVPLARNVKYASQVKRTSCVKCAFGTIYGTLNFTLRQWRNTSLFRKQLRQYPNSPKSSKIAVFQRCRSWNTSVFLRPAALKNNLFYLVLVQRIFGAVFLRQCEAKTELMLTHLREF